MNGKLEGNTSPSAGPPPPPEGRTLLNYSCATQVCSLSVFVQTVRNVSPGVPLSPASPVAEGPGSHCRRHAYRPSLYEPNGEVQLQHVASPTRAVPCPVPFHVGKHFATEQFPFCCVELHSVCSLEKTRRMCTHARSPPCVLC